jgi:GxxExxY protein
MELIYEDLTRELIGCFFDVHNALGVGYDERAYHKGLERRFRKKGFDHRSEERKALVHRGRKVREFKADLITFDKIILELKTLQSGFIKANYVQIISELKLWQMHLGLLVNFDLQKVAIERIPFTEKDRTELPTRTSRNQIGEEVSQLAGLPVNQLTGQLANRPTFCFFCKDLTLKKLLSSVTMVKRSVSSR